MTHYNTRGAAPLKATPRREGGEGGTPITIGNKVRLGANVLVLPGVTIGDNTVVGTGSVVTRNLPANVIAVGNPARVYRDLPTDT
ncbi:DapH/DapD/GlmU-related protein [Mobiluncus mulieris]|uniref:Acetyltransferase n=1 Tax=Mobiluncus mulieris TaxID=2052 RepID=A0A7Y0UTY1_9ACTO|nr:galactoside O-acetyltransferase [Mobiluncus mulieris]